MQRAFFKTFLKKKKIMLSQAPDLIGCIREGTVFSSECPDQSCYFYFNSVNESNRVLVI